MLCYSIKQLKEQRRYPSLKGGGGQCVQHKEIVAKLSFRTPLRRDLKRASVTERNLFYFITLIIFQISHCVRNDKKLKLTALGRGG